MARRFEIEDTITRQYSRFNATGTQPVVRLLTPSDGTDPVSDFLASLNDSFRHAIQNLSESDMVGITIQNRVYQNEKPIGIRFRLRTSWRGMLYCLWSKRFHNETRFNALDKLIMTVHSLRMSVVLGKRGLKRRGRPLSVMAHLKRSRWGEVSRKLYGPCNNNSYTKAENDPN